MGRAHDRDVFIELTEYLRCPVPHETEMHLVLVPDRMVGRMVLEGTIGCPVCHREYPVRHGIAVFDREPVASTPALTPDPALLAEAVRALLALSNPGGYVVLVGSGVALAPALAAVMGGIHFVGVNPPAGVEVTPSLSLLVHGTDLPLRTKMARGVVMSAEASAAWLEEGARVLLGGLRLVALRADVEAPAGLERLASGLGLWVGEKRR